MIKKFKGFIGLLLSIIMMFQAAVPAFASQISDDYIVDESYEILLEDEEFQASLAELDELAQQYYDYYQEHGEYPSYDVELYISANMAIDYLNAAGFAITASSFAELAASLGSLAGIGSALPAAIVVGIIIGITYAAYTSLVSSAGVKKLDSQVSSVVTEVGNHVTKNKSEARSNARESVITSADYWRNRRNYEYFECVRVSGYEGDGLGGILVGEPLTYKEAYAIVKNNDSNGPDVFCVSYGYASTLADDGCDAGEVPYYHTRHNGINQPYNCPHFHSTIDGEKGNVHIFFEDDVW